MRNRFIALLTFCVLAAASLPSWAAQSAFFLQLGNAPTSDDAQAKWQKLTADYPALLSGLTFTPRTIKALDDGPGEVRLQAGPVRSRASAQRLCGQLSAKGVECFIVETAVIGGTPSFASAPLATSPLPEPVITLAAAAPVTAAASDESSPAPEATPPAEQSAEASTKEKKSSGSFFSQIFSSMPKHQEEVAAMPIEPQPIATAVVAQPVEAPVEEEKHSGSFISRLFSSPPKHQQEAAPKPETPVAAAVPPQKLPWLHEAPPAEMAFSEEPSHEEQEAGRGRVEVAEAVRVPVDSAPAEDAMAVQEMPPRVAARAPAAHTSLVMVAHRERSLLHGARDDEGWTQIGGFANEQQAYNFSQSLHATMQDRGRLRTRITRQLLIGHSGDRPISLLVGPVENDAMAERVCSFAAQNGAQCGGLRQEIAPTRYAAREAASTTLAPAPQDAMPRSSFAGNPAPSRYWVQLGSWKNAAEAQQRFSDLQRRNTQLRGYRPDISAPPHVSLYAKPAVRLRVGPFPTRPPAQGLCDALTIQGTSCIVVPE